MTDVVKPAERIFRRYPGTDADKRDAALADDYRRTFGTPHGARVLADIMHQASMFQSTLSTERATRDMIDGKRELAMTIFELAGFCGSELPAAMIADNIRKAETKEADRDRTEQWPARDAWDADEFTAGDAD